MPKLETRYDLDKLRLRAYNLLVEDQCHQATDLLNEHVEEDKPTHRLLDVVRLRERQLQVTGDNLEGAMKLLNDAKEATEHSKIGVNPLTY